MKIGSLEVPSGHITSPIVADHITNKKVYITEKKESVNTTGI